MKLIKEINELRDGDIKKQVEKRLKEFRSFRRKDEKDWFSELCFCILTANSRAKSAIEIQQELGAEGFWEGNSEKILECIKKKKHRFHNNKTNYIMDARNYLNIKEITEGIVGKDGESEAREWIVGHIRGLGYKEASHFLRNVGYVDLAILDRHILKLMSENAIINKTPNALMKNRYLEIEEKFRELAQQLTMNCAELDLYMWYLKTGEILK